MRKPTRFVFVTLACFALFTLIARAADQRAIEAWPLTAPLPHALASEQVVSVGDKLYMIGGRTVDGPVNEVAMAKIDLNHNGVLPAWQPLPTILPTSIYLHAAVAVDDHIFSIGGYDDRERYSAVYKANVMDSITGTLSNWTKENDLPLKLLLHSAVVVNERIYVLGGVDENNTALKTVYFATFDHNNNTLSPWMETKALPRTLFRMAVTAAHMGAKDYIYVIGGFDGSKARSEIYRTEVDSSTGGLVGWKTDTTLNNPLYYHAAVVLGNRLFVLGGKNDTDEFTHVDSAVIDDGDGHLHHWESQASLPVSLYRLDASTVSTSGYALIYILGGLHGEVYQSQVYLGSPVTRLVYLPVVGR